MDIILVAIFGLVVGSFLNVVVLRMHAGRDYKRGRSACPHCGHELSASELVPVFSWLIQRGRCKHCGKAISIQYPIVELITAGLFLGAYLTQPLFSLADYLVLAMWFYIIGSLVVLAVYDLRWYLLPDKILIPVIIPATAILLAETLVFRHISSIWHPFLAALAFGGAFYAIAAVSRGKWMGGGDIKLAFVMGLLLGLQKTALAMLLAFCTAALVGGLLILLGRKTRKDFIPFGPFLIGGTLVAYLYGTPIIHWYLNISGLNLL
ncbi:MAG TPA: prepilin peptidase [Candidatus Saccharimonadales bacterium]|nr:prepilin peptidase [Candidatus Saccharimonadales bacterium]